MEVTATSDPHVSRKPMPLFGRALVWSFILSAYFMIVYNGANWITSKRPHVGTLYFSWERHIPFVAAAIYPYMSIDIFFFFSPLLCRDLAELRTLAKRILLAITLAGVCFLLFPLQMGTQRPSVGGVEGMLFTLLGGFDKPYNLVPSLHIGLLCILWVVYSRHTRGVLRLAIQVWFVLIVISCVLTNQHHVIDIVGGYLLGIVCLYLVPESPATAGIHGPRKGRVGNRKVAFNYTAGSIALAIGAVLLYPWGLLLLWPSIAGALVALAYFRVDVGIFRKRHGRLPWSSRIILLPYLLISGVFHVRMKRRCDPFSEVAPGVWVGARLSPTQAKILADKGVAAVLDLTAECSETPMLLGMRYRNLQLLDLTPPTIADLDTAVAFLQENAAEGVYLHCALGMSRSVCVVAAYLISLNPSRSIDDAFSTIKSIRSVARLHRPARRVLEDYRLFLENRQPH